MVMASLMNQKSTSVQNATSENKTDNNNMTRLLTKSQAGEFGEWSDRAHGRGINREWREMQSAAAVEGERRPPPYLSATCLMLLTVKTWGLHGGGSGCVGDGGGWCCCCWWGSQSCQLWYWCLRVCWWRLLVDENEIGSTTGSGWPSACFHHRWMGSKNAKWRWRKGNELKKWRKRNTKLPFIHQPTINTFHPTELCEAFFLHYVIYCKDFAIYRTVSLKI